MTNTPGIPSYEEIAALIAVVPNSSCEEARDVRWLSESESLGVARDQEGRLEIFLTGPEIRPRSNALREAIRFHHWRRRGGAPLQASRLMLPAFAHYDQICAFICVELLRNDVDSDVVAAFARAEPIIGLTIKRLELSMESMLGLAGELLLLDGLCRAAQPRDLGLVVESWQGWHRSTRDFRFGSTGVEVKTTTRAVSAHSVQGVHQVEAHDGSDGTAAEEALMLVSIGLDMSVPGENAFSIPGLVEQIQEVLGAAGHEASAERFTTHVAHYGSESGFGYEHRTMAHEPPFTRSYGVVFFRGYQMQDPFIEVLRRDDLAALSHIDASSVQFTLSLPTVLRQENPVTGRNQIAQHLLNRLRLQ